MLTVMDGTGIDEAPAPEDSVPLNRRVCVALVAAAILATAAIDPLIALVNGLAYLPALFVLSHDYDETTAPPLWQVWFTIALGGLVGLIVGGYAEAAVANMLAQEARAAATHCQARSFGACGLGTFWLSIEVTFGVPIVAIVTGIVLSICRVRRGLFIALVAGATSVMLGYVAGRVVRSIRTTSCWR